MTIHIREARVDDEPEWSRMRTLLWPSASAEEHAQELAAWRGTDNLALTLVAERAPGKLGGFLEVSIRDQEEGPLPWIEGWFVDEDRRGQGVGRKLVVAAEKWARGEGYGEIGSDTEIENTKSIAAHKALGYEELERIVIFRKKLG